MTVQAGSQDGCRRGAGQSPGIRVSSRSCILPAAYFQCVCDRCFHDSPSLRPPAPRNSRKPIDHGGGQQKPGSKEFCEMGPAGACAADYPEHIAPKSPQEHRFGSPILSEQIVNQPFLLAQCSQIDFLVPADLEIRPNGIFFSRRIMKVGKLPKAAEAVDAREAFPRPSPPGHQLFRRSGKLQICRDRHLPERRNGAAVCIRSMHTHAPIRSRLS